LDGVVESTLTVKEWKRECESACVGMVAKTATIPLHCKNGDARITFENSGIQ
jgi:hypothetical protein